MGLMKKLTSALVASSLVLGLVGTAFAAPSTEQLNDAYERLYHYGIVQGIAKPDGTQDPALGATLTRAQLVTILVRAFGGEDTANLLKGAKSYEDVAANEWYSGYVALIKNMAEKQGIAIGYEDGTFRPAQNVTAIEALAFVMKMLGVPTGTGANWVAETIAAAKDAGVITAADAEAYLADPNSPATRGLAFGLADAIFSTFEVAEGATVYTTYVDDEAPALTLDAAAEPTTTATMYTITGSVSGAEALYFGSEQIAANEDGTFSLEVNLEVGVNTFTFTAVDLAGNVTTQAFEITRNKGAAANVAATLSSDSITAGGTAELTVVVTDENGVELDVAAEDIKVTIGGEIGTYADGVFTASTKAGAGTITVTVGELAAEAIDVTVVAGPLAKVSADKLSIGIGGKSTLTAQDEYGNAITGATFSADSADAFLNGNVFTGTTSGNYVITATKDGKSATVTVGVFGAATAVKVELSQSSLVANGTTEIVATATVVDANGNAVTNAAGTVALQDSATTGLTETADGTFANGVQKFKVKTNGAVPGQQMTMTATFTPTSGSPVEGKATVDIVAQVASAVKLTTKPGTYVATNSNTGVPVVAKVVDQAGEPMKSGAWSVTFSVAGSATVTASGDAVPGTATTYSIDYVGNIQDAAAKLWALQGVTGPITVTASVEGIGTDSASTTAAIAGNPAKLTVSSDVTSAKAAAQGRIVYTVTVTDANGVPVILDDTNPTTLTVKLGVADATTAGKLYYADGDVALATLDDTPAALSNNLTLAANTSSAKFTLGAFNFVGSVPVTVEYTGLSSAGNTVSFTAGDAAKVVLDQNGKNYVVALNNTTFNVSGKVTDAAGNAVAISGLKVKLVARNASDTADETKVNINGTAQNATVATDANGAFTATVSTQTYPDLSFIVKMEDVVTTDAIAPVATDKVAATVEAAVPASISIVSVKDSVTSVASVAAGTAVTVTVEVKDQYGNPLMLDAVAANNPLKLSFTSGKALATDGVTDITTTGIATPTAVVDAAKGLASYTFYPTVVPSTGFKVSATNTVATVESAASLVGVTPAAVTADTVKVKLVRATTATAIEPTKDAISGPYTVTLTDAYGNAVAAPAAITVLITTANLEAGEYLYVRESSSAGAANVTSITINAGYSSKAVYVLTNATTANSDATADTLQLSVDHPTATDVIDDSITVKAK
ncbi:MAG: hypothetical protein ACOY94_23525 [Bacillota bacterium]